MDVGWSELFDAMLVLSATWADDPLHGQAVIARKLPGMPVPNGRQGNSKLIRNPPRPKTFFVAKSQRLRNRCAAMHRRFRAMRLRGLEPPRGFPHEHLKLARIPNFATAAGSCNLHGRTSRRTQCQSNTRS